MPSACTVATKTVARTAAVSSRVTLETIVASHPTSRRRACIGRRLRRCGSQTCFLDTLPPTLLTRYVRYGFSVVKREPRRPHPSSGVSYTYYMCVVCGPRRSFNKIFLVFEKHFFPHIFFVS